MNAASSINSGNITDARVYAQMEADWIEPIGTAQIQTGAIIPAKVASGFTTGKFIIWFSGSNSYSTTSTGFVQIDAFSDSFTFSGGPCTIALAVGGFTQTGGNSYFGVRIGSTDYQILPTTNLSGVSISGQRFIAAWSATGSQAVMPIFRNGNGLTTAVPAFVELTVSITDWGK